MKVLLLLPLLISSFAFAQQDSRVQVLPKGEVLPQPTVKHFDCGIISFPALRTFGNNDDGNVSGFETQIDEGNITLTSGGGRLKCAIPRSLVESKGYTIESFKEKLLCRNPNADTSNFYSPDHFVILNCIGDARRDGFTSGGSKKGGFTSGMVIPDFDFATTTNYGAIDGVANEVSQIITTTATDFSIKVQTGPGANSQK